MGSRGRLVSCAGIYIYYLYIFVVVRRMKEERKLAGRREEGRLRVKEREIPRKKRKKKT